MDGLAAGVGLFATVTTLIAALLQNNMALALATVPLAGSLLGFLRYNFTPASIFLGDSGSLTIGFVLGCYGVIWSQKSATMLGMTAPLIALAFPILDVVLSILRRFLRRRSIFEGDRGHIHHRLLDRGLTPRRVALVVYGACGLFATLSLLQSMFHQGFAGLILVLFCAVSWIGIHNLRYAEFRMASRLLLGGAFQNMLNAQLTLRRLGEMLEAAETVEECWPALEEACEQFGFREVEWYIEGDILRYTANGRRLAPPCWELLVPLTATSFINLRREFDSPCLPMLVAPFVEMLRNSLGRKARRTEVPVGQLVNW